MAELPVKGLMVEAAACGIFYINRLMPVYAGFSLSCVGVWVCEREQTATASTTRRFLWGCTSK